MNPRIAEQKHRWMVYEGLVPSIMSLSHRQDRGRFWPWLQLPVPRCLPLVPFAKVPFWLWVKNRVTPKWKPGKYKHGLKPAVLWECNFDPHLFGGALLVDVPCSSPRLSTLSVLSANILQGWIHKSRQPHRFLDFCTVWSGCVGVWTEYRPSVCPSGGL